MPRMILNVDYEYLVFKDAAGHFIGIVSTFTSTRTISLVATTIKAAYAEMAKLLNINQSVIQ